MFKDEEQQGLQAIQSKCAVALPMALRAAIELDVLEIMANAGPGAMLSAAQIASHLPTSNPHAPLLLDRLLKLLASHSLLTCSLATADDGLAHLLYDLAPMTKLFLTKDKGGVSMAPLILLLNDKVFMHAWYHIKDAILEGDNPFERAYGMNAFEYPATDHRFNKLFNDGMLNPTIVIMKKVLETYKGFEGLEKVVDVGGGVGVALNMIISKYPHIKGVNFDLPHVIDEAPTFPGVEHVAGDMFVSVPRAKAIFMKWILHDWSDEHCIKLLKNCYKALPDTGKVIVMESILPTKPEANVASQCYFQQDLLMLAFNPGGKERTEEQFGSLAKEAGFASINTVGQAFNLFVIEFVKVK